MKYKVVVAGAFKYPIYQEALSEGIEKIGNIVYRVKLKDDSPYNIGLSIRNGKILIKEIKKNRPDILFLYRVENLLPCYVRKLRESYPKMVIMQYHNDDPFRKGFKRYIKSYQYLHYIRYTDITYVYRPININEAKKWGAKLSKLYMSHYYTKTDFKELNRNDCLNKNGKVVFLGHWENDDRIEYIRECYRQGINLHIYGSDNWHDVFVKYNLPLENLHPSVRGEEYIRVIHDSSIALAFFSKANRDEYTRRCYEIPIAGTVLLQPSTIITREIFKDGVDAILYNNVEDLVNKVKLLLGNQEKLTEIAYNGYCLMKNGPFSEYARAQMVIDDYEQIIKSRK